LWINFLIQVPVGVALGFDKPASNLMEHKPRPLKQPILSRNQWVRVGFLGLLTAILTVYLESVYVAEGTTIAATMGFVVFSLFIVVLALSSRSETASAFNRGIIQNRQQLLLYGFALLMAILPTRLDFLQDFLGLTELAFEQWMICIVLAIAVLLVDEAIKFFMRRSR
jgi:Ca2+-transporting ATPase